MYAIIENGNKQYKVSEGDVVRVEKLDAQVGDTVESRRSWFPQTTESKRARKRPAPK